MYLEGTHLSLYVLVPSCHNQQSTQDCRFFSHCLTSHIKAHQTRQSGLTSSHIAVIGGSSLVNHNQRTLNECGFSEWYPLPPTSHTPTPTSEGTSHLDNALQRLTQLCSEGSSHCHGDSDGCRELEEMSDIIHQLLDKLPASVHKDDKYYLMDVFWLVPNTDQLPLPDSTIGFFGALLRLQKWNHAHIHMVTQSPVPLTAMGVCEWCEALPSLSVTPLGEWESPSGMVWQGSIHCTEHKVCKTATHKTLSFPGFALKLLPPEAMPTTLVNTHHPHPEDILHGVGLTGPFIPTHLEVLQVVDMATVPLFWLSPLHCELSLRNIPSNPSKHLFHTLLSCDEHQNKAGVIVCLCTKSHDPLREPATKSSNKDCFGNTSSELVPGDKPIRNKTTSEWVEFVQGLEEESDSPPAPLLSYCTGPRLLVTPSHTLTSNHTVSCDAWFLWKPEMIDTELVSRTMLQPTKVADDLDDDCEGLFSSKLSAQLVGELRERVAAFSSSEFDVAPSDSSEIKALKTYEWIQRKMIRRIATPDLMFGHMVAPPPRNVTSQLDSLDIGDVLNCFTEHGTPITSELSPIAMSGSSRPIKVRVPDPGLSYKSIIASTPTSKKQYHGVSYCLSEEDTSVDARLTKIQQRYLFSERASHCNPVVTPRAERAKQQARRMRSESVSLNPSNREQESESRTKSIPPEADKSPVKKATPQSKRHFTQGRPPNHLMKSPVIKITRVPQKRLKTSKPSNFIASGPKEHLSNTTHYQNKDQTSSIPIMPTKHNQVHEEACSTEHSVVARDKVESGEVSVNSEGGGVGCDKSSSCEAVRRSPRKNKWKAKTKQKKETSKSRLSTEVVSALKQNGMARSHPSFRKCFNRLFFVSKSFLQDLDMKSLKGVAAQKEEIKRVVELNVQNVLDFELSNKHKKAS